MACWACPCGPPGVELGSRNARKAVYPVRAKLKMRNVLLEMRREWSAMARNDGWEMDVPKPSPEADEPHQHPYDQEWCGEKGGLVRYGRGGIRFAERRDSGRMRTVESDVVVHCLENKQDQRCNTGTISKATNEGDEERHTGQRSSKVRQSRQHVYPQPQPRLPDVRTRWCTTRSPNVVRSESASAVSS